jgi:hypothetical protein
MAIPIDAIRRAYIEQMAILIFTRPRDLTFSIEKRGKKYRFKITVGTKTIEGDYVTPRKEAVSQLIDNLIALLDVGPELLQQESKKYSDYFDDGRLKTSLVFTQEILDRIVASLQHRNSVSTRRFKAAA